MAEEQELQYVCRQVRVLDVAQRRGRVGQLERRMASQQLLALAWVLLLGRVLAPQLGMEQRLGMGCVFQLALALDEAQQRAHAW